MSTKYTPKNNAIARARFARWSLNPAADIAKRSRIAKNIGSYDPRRNDWEGVDTPGSSMPAKRGTKRARSTSAPKRKRKAGVSSARWKTHVKKTRASMPNAAYKTVLKAASRSYKKKAPAKKRAYTKRKAPAKKWLTEVAGTGGFSSRKAWLAHLKASKSKEEASKTWIKKGTDPFTNFMAAGGNQDVIPLNPPQDKYDYVKELTALEDMYKIQDSRKV